GPYGRRCRFGPRSSSASAADRAGASGGSGSGWLRVGKRSLDGVLPLKLRWQARIRDVNTEAVNAKQTGAAVTTAARRLAPIVDGTGATTAARVATCPGGRYPVPPPSR